MLYKAAGLMFGRSLAWRIDTLCIYVALSGGIWVRSRKLGGIYISLDEI